MSVISNKGGKLIRSNKTLEGVQKFQSKVLADMAEF